jgi:DNA replication protein DnaC
MRRHNENPKNSSYGLCKCYIEYDFVKGLILSGMPMKFKNISHEDISHREASIDGKIDKKSINDIVEWYVNKYYKLRKDSIGLNLIGKIGTGRTFISQFIGAQLLRQRYSIHYLPFFTLAKKMGAFDDSALLEEIFDVDFLIIDEIGNEHASRRGYSGEIAYLVQKRIQNKKPTIFGMNEFKSEAEIIEAYGGSFFSVINERNVNIKLTKRAISKTAKTKYMNRMLG